MVYIIVGLLLGGAVVLILGVVQALAELEKR